MWGMGWGERKVFLKLVQTTVSFHRTNWSLICVHSFGVGVETHLEFHPGAGAILARGRFPAAKPSTL
jgi:hypothetical protein